MVAKDKNDLIDALTDAWNRVARLEEEWQDFNAEMCFTREERQEEQMYRDLMAARDRLKSIQAAAMRDRQ